MMRCTHCGYIFVESNVERSKINYSGSYAEKIRGDFRLGTSNDSYAREVLKQIESLSERGRILDIGCGAGFFLNYARNAGWQTYGVELTIENARYASEHLGLNVKNVSIEDSKFPDNFFDVVTMWDVIEHLNNPRETIAHLFNIIKDNGLLCVETPNTESIYRALLGKYWIAFADSTHIRFFNKTNLKVLLEKSGFKVVKIQSTNVRFFSLEGLRRMRLYRYYYDLALVIGKIFPALIPSCRDDVNKVTKCLNYPTDILFESLYRGDQIRIFARKNG
jgi:2-polyprenyl-3-methyl-5-hydroxy-6-metoxy-1,4-benzoquinol methylase